MTPWAVPVALGSFLIGRVADRVQAASVSSASLLLTAAGFLLLRTMGSHVSDFGIGARIAIAGLGFDFFQPPNNRAILLAAPLARSGAASGIVSAARLFGQTIGAILVATVFVLVGGSRGPRVCTGHGAAMALFGAALSASRIFLREHRSP